MSADASEFLITSCQSGNQLLWNFNSESGNILQQFKNGGVASTNTLSQIGEDFFITAEQSKPLLHVWPVNSQEQVKNIRFILPEPASALAVSPDNEYLACGIGSKLYIWQICSGKLLCIQQKHLLPITCVKFSLNGGCVITACQAGMLITYNFGNLVCLHNNQLAQSEIGQVEPMYSRRDHTSAITDIYVGNFRMKARFATVSNDYTCRMYDLLTGQPLLQLICDEPLSAVIFNTTCWQLFLGTNSGVIEQFSVRNPPRTLSVHVDSEKNNRLKFVGHKGRVVCLDLNTTNEILVSGADDSVVLVWNIYSRQMLNKIDHKGAVCNVRFILKNNNLFAQTFKPRLVLKTLERSVDSDSDNFVLSAIDNEKIDFSFDEDAEKERDVADYKQEILKIKAMNKQLYNALFDTR